MQIYGWNANLDAFILNFLKYVIKFSDQTKQIIEVLRPNLETILLDDEFVRKSPRSVLTDIKRSLAKKWIIILIELNEPLGWQASMESIVLPGIFSQIIRTKELAKTVQILNLLCSYV